MLKINNSSEKVKFDYFFPQRALFSSCVTCCVATTQLTEIQQDSNSPKDVHNSFEITVWLRNLGVYSTGCGISRILSSPSSSFLPSLMALPFFVTSIIGLAGRISSHETCNILHELSHRGLLIPLPEMTSWAIHCNSCL